MQGKTTFHNEWFTASVWSFLAPVWSSHESLSVVMMQSFIIIALPLHISEVTVWLYITKILSHLYTIQGSLCTLYNRVHWSMVLILFFIVMRHTFLNLQKNSNKIFRKASFLYFERFYPYIGFSATKYGKLTFWEIKFFLVIDHNG